MIRRINFCLKRISDILISLCCLIITFPVMGIGIIGILMTMPGPIFFRQQRVGRYGTDFYVLKLRTMKVDKKAERNRDMSRDEERKTKWGNILRRFKIDELPQIFNVLKGDMSLVGPRPTVREHVILYDERERHRLDVRPGMTGLAQVNGNTALVWEDRIKYDLKYINNYSIFLDLKILLGTIKVIIFGEERFCRPLSNMSFEDSKFYW